jgi:DNA-binding response OmpR family regulator
MEMKYRMLDKKAVLIVDDDETICKTISLILEGVGYKTDFVLNGREAMDKARSGYYDVVLLDLKLPDMEGTHLLKAIQKLTPNTVKIILTGYPELQTSIDALNWGADAYLVKPINPAEIIKTIEEKLEEVEEAKAINEKKISMFLAERAKKLLAESK